MNAQDGCYDDQLMSYMIAQEMRARMPARIVKPRNLPQTQALDGQLMINAQPKALRKVASIPRDCSN
ncbi:terminase [Aeromonas hydrophila]|nr:terminase [Aeromonas hydrophila]